MKEGGRIKFPCAKAGCISAERDLGQETHLASSFGHYFFFRRHFWLEKAQSL